MTSRVEILDDPSHPEGGHALIRFLGLSGPTGPGKLLIEPEGFVYDGARSIDVLGVVTEQGLQFAVDGGQLDRLGVGTTVILSLQGSGITHDVLWPALTPLRIATARGRLRTGKASRTVVAIAGLPLAPTDPDPDPVDPKPQRLVLRPADPPKSGTAIDAAAPDPSGVPVPDPAPSPITDAPPAQTSSPGPVNLGPISPGPINLEPVAKLAAVHRSGWSPRVVAVVAAFAFGAGAAATGIVWLTQGAAGRQTTATAILDHLPSPYAMLRDLSTRSPDGVAVEGNDFAGFLARSRSAKTAQESSFWRKWAMRALLEARTNGTAAIMSDFATDFAEAQREPARLAAARFLWEMAAIAGDCSAMQNIAIAGTAGGGDEAQSSVWQERARLCRNRAGLAP